METDRIVKASVFKQRCLALLDQVATTRVPLLVTKHGRPVARVVPLGDEGEAKDTRGSVRLLSRKDQDYFSTGEPWNES